MNERNRISEVYRDGVEDFINFAVTNDIEKLSTIICPCVKCRNKLRFPAKEVRNHLFINGINKTYTTWLLHGERPLSTQHLSVEHVEIDGTLCEEDIGNVGAEMGNLVDACYGVQDEYNVDGEVGETGASEERDAPNAKYNEYKRLAMEKLYPSCNSQQPSRFSAPQPSSQSSGTAKEKAKLLIIIGPTGIVVGANSRKWSNRVGDYVRSCISVKYSDFRQVPQNFKDDVWRNLMEEAMPENPIDKVDAWLAGHQKENGTVLPSAKPLYDQVKEIKTKRKSGEDGSSSTIENDGLTQVFGKDIKGRLRGVGSHISKKQMVIVEIEKQREWQRIRKKQKMMPLRMK
ncbi:hypothetical protein LguiB_005542 [Lonicera macranthoides]